MSIVALEGKTFVSDLEDRPGTSFGSRREHWLVRKEWGAQQISMRYFVFAHGVSPAQRNSESEEVWFVLDGKGAVLLNDHSYQIEKDTGVYIRPGVWARVENLSPKPLHIISVVCPEENSEVTLDFTAQPLKQTIPCPVIRLSDRPAMPAGDRSYQVLVDTDIGAQQLTQFVGVIPPGRAPDHHHTYEEVITILEGTGFMWAGKTKTPVAPGSCIYLPAEQTHCLENTSNGPMRLMGVFYPSGSPATNYPG